MEFLDRLWGILICQFSYLSSVFLGIPGFPHAPFSAFWNWHQENRFSNAVNGWNLKWLAAFMKGMVPVWDHV